MASELRSEPARYDHAEAARSLLDRARELSSEGAVPERDRLIAEAQTHATLAVAEGLERIRAALAREDAWWRRA